jgi:hypothetical protein
MPAERSPTSLHSGEEPPPGDPGGVAVAPPRVGRKLTASPSATYRATRRTLAVRHVSQHRLVALVEILSPANKDRQSSVDEFVEKVHSMLQAGCHMLAVDLFPPGAFDPQGAHEAIWSWFRDPGETIEPADKPLTLAAYVAGQVPEAYTEPLAVGDLLPEMPLFLDIRRHVNVPLESTYTAAYRGVPGWWRGVLEGQTSREQDR